jgi:PAS domain S-box-containing protein
MLDTAAGGAWNLPRFDVMSTPGGTEERPHASHDRERTHGPAQERTPAAALPGAALYRLLIESVQDYAIFVLDPAGRMMSWNAGAERLKGYTAQQVIGRHFSMFYPPEDVAAGKPERALRKAALAGRIEDEGWRVRKDGRRFWANVVITALRTRDGELVGFAKVTRDLTERRRAQERALEDARRIADAEAASRTKSEFLAAMSHELRTPINAALGYVELLALGLGGPLTEQQRDYLARIRRSQQHLLGIINDLLNYSRIEAGRLEYALVPVTVRAIVDAVLPMIEPQALTKGVEIRVEWLNDEVTVVADPMKAEQVLLNILSNAVKFTPAGGNVRVLCAAAADSASIAVSDTGPGIPQEQQVAVFQPFVQLGRTLTSGHEGTGLGLAISRDLARAMGGDVFLQGSSGAGSTFVLRLPRP